MIMELTRYEVFADAAKTGNFTKTADRMGYTQPGVSRTLRLLERELGFPLFCMCAACSQRINCSSSTSRTSRGSRRAI